MKLIYKQIKGDITSFAIGFNAGAIEEEGYPLGTAHAVEHMVFKGTKTKSEDEINVLCDEIFGFQNAMTNYPYVVYYGTTLSEDFERGLELFSDIILNPAFPEDGFKEEMNIIREELKEWADDPYQHCEDELLYNSFNNRRIKNLIIGSEESLDSITLNHIKNFYKKYYKLSDMVLTVVTSLDFTEALAVVQKLFKGEKEESNLEKINDADLYEENNGKVFIKNKSDISGAKILFTYPIHKLNYEEIRALKVFNHYFGEGTSSILYSNIRTKNALAYEIGSAIKNERGIKLFSIHLGTSQNKVYEAIEIVKSSIEEIKKEKYFFTKDKIEKASKSIKLKKALRLEKSIQLAKDLTCYELMYGNHKEVYDEVEGLEFLQGEFINEVIKKVLQNPSIQILI